MKLLKSRCHVKRKRRKIKIRIETGKRVHDEISTPPRVVICLMTAGDGRPTSGREENTHHAFRRCVMVHTTMPGSPAFTRCPVCDSCRKCRGGIEKLTSDLDVSHFFICRTVMYVF